MKRPSFVHICGKIYTIEWTSRVPGDDNAGYCRAILCRIYVSTEMDEQQMRDTLLHEIFHALHYETGIGAQEQKTEESIIHPISTALLTVLRDNPAVVRYLLSK